MSRSSTKEIFMNLLYSFTSYAMPTAILQFVVQPIIAQYLGADLNGQYLTLMSFNYFLMGTTATVLSTVRMLQQKEYNDRHFVGDFNIFYLIYSGIILISMPIAYICYSGTIELIDILLYVIIGNLYLYHNYILCQFRLKLQYSKILIDNVLQVVGYGIGVVLFITVHRWQLVYISAYIISSVYNFLNTDFIREPIRKTPLMNKTKKILLLYSCSMVLSSMHTYCDKLILYPILGGESVSVYNTASIVGKILILISAPLNSVLLSYIVKMESLKYKVNGKQICVVTFCILFAYAGCVGVGYPVTDMLYPLWAAKSHLYIPFTVAASLINLFAGLFNTVLLRFCNMKFQIWIQFINLCTYLVISFGLLYIWGLFGFCIGITIAAIIKLILIVYIFYKKRDDLKEENQ